MELEYFRESERESIRTTRMSEPVWRVSADGASPAAAENTKDH